MKTGLRVAALAAVCASALSSPAQADHWWGGYYWANGASRQINVNTAVSGAWVSDPMAGGANHILKAFQGWDKDSSQSPLDLTGPTARAGTNPKTCKAIADQVLVCNARYGFNGWLGIASIWANSSKQITQATTKLNDSYYGSAKYNTPAWRRLVSCQEIGHDFGLAHQNEIFDNANTGSCMDYTNAPGGGVLNGFNYGPTNEYPNAHDYDMLDTIYGASSSAALTGNATTDFGIRTVGQGGTSAADASRPNDDGIPGDSEAAWGRAVHTDSQGRPDVFVLDLAGGHKKITHVFWAIGEGPRSEHHHDDH